MKKVKRVLTALLCMALFLSVSPVPARAEETVTVIFNSGGGSCEVGEKTVTKGSLVEKPADPVWKYHTFEGWFADEGFTKAWNFEKDTVIADMTLYAKWSYKLLSVGIGGTGNGVIACADPGEAAVFDEEYPITHYVSIIPGVHEIAAKPNEGSRFVAWQYGDGTFYSADPVTTVTLADKDIELKAEFELLPWMTATLEIANGRKWEHVIESEARIVLYILEKAGELTLAPSPEGMEFLKIYNNPDSTTCFYLDESSGRFAYGEGYRDIRVEITDDLRDAMWTELDAPVVSEDKAGMLQDIIRNYAAVELICDPLISMTIDVDGCGRFTYGFEEEELDYGEDNLSQSAYVPYIGTHKVGAKADPGWEFLKWTLNGEDYSTDSEITVDVYEKDVELVAVFEHHPGKLQNGGGSEGAQIVNTDEELYFLIDLDLEETIAQGEGKNVTVFLRVKDITSTVAESEKNLVKQMLGANDVAGQYLDIRLFKQVEGEEPVQIFTLDGMLKISLPIPENLQKDGRKFFMVRIHDGKAEKIEGTVENGRLIFETDQFSTYTLAYVEEVKKPAETNSGTSPQGGAAASGEKEVPKTGDESLAALYGLMLCMSLAAACCAGLLTRRKRKSSL